MLSTSTETVIIIRINLTLYIDKSAKICKRRNEERKFTRRWLLLDTIEAKKKEQRANFCEAAGARLPSAPAKLIASRNSNPQVRSRRRKYLSSLFEEYRLDVLPNEHFQSASQQFLLL